MLDEYTELWLSRLVNGVAAGFMPYDRGCLVGGRVLRGLILNDVEMLLSRYCYQMAYLGNISDNKVTFTVRWAPPAGGYKQYCGVQFYDGQVYVSELPATWRCLP